VARGLDPLRPPERILDRSRYAAMEAFLDVEGFAGRTMMCSTAAVQVNLDNGSPATLAERWHLAHALGPVLVATFAHSPVPGGGGRGPRSARQQVWSVMDPSRTGPVHGPILGGAGAGSPSGPAPGLARAAHDRRPPRPLVAGSGGGDDRPRQRRRRRSRRARGRRRPTRRDGRGRPLAQRRPPRPGRPGPAGRRPEGVPRRPR